MVQALRLTSFSHGAGCACKLGPRDLTRVLDLLGPTTKPQDVLVSEETGDDAAVYRLADGTGLVLTLDFFTPLVDDPRDWGRIAAANALSDVYAMGGTPRLALNVAGWPVDELPLELLADVLAGAREVAVGAGVSVVGGHTITTEKEPLFGMVAVRLGDAGATWRVATSSPVGPNATTRGCRRSPDGASSPHPNRSCSPTRKRAGDSSLLRTGARPRSCSPRSARSWRDPRAPSA